MVSKKRVKLKGDPYAGLNGGQIGQKKLEEFEIWVAEVEHACSQGNWKGKFAGTASREKIAIHGLGWKSKTPFHQNVSLKDAISRVEKKWYGGPEKQSVKAINAALDHSQMAVQRTSIDSNRLVSKISELEAEVRTLRKRVRAYEEQRDLIARGVPGFELP